MTAQKLAPGTAEWAAFVTALSTAGLPVDDLAATTQRFFVLEDGAAYGGFAYRGSVALLRSLVVAPERRRSGIGGAALDDLLGEIRRAGAAEVWLLTMGAADFFARHGFRAVDRRSAPALVKDSAQFSTLCPASAVLMCKTLV